MSSTAVNNNNANATIDELIASLSPHKRFIVVTGGVMSGIGKGVTTSSIGVLLKLMHHTVSAIKIDPYLNVDAGTMSPYEHGEVFVLNDGSETDLDLGNYERFLNIALTQDSNITTGKVYQTVIQRERQGGYLGKTVQIIPHVTNEIIRRILHVAQTPIDGHEVDVVMIEMGGTIGDIESMPFVEALRQLQLKVSPAHFCVVHVSNIPEVGPNKEQKTKPTQHSVKELRALGISPDFIVCRCSSSIEESNRQKIALFCNVPVHHVISSHDVSNIYQIPAMFLQQHLHQSLMTRLQTRISSADIDQVLFSQWQAFAHAVDDVHEEVHVAMIAKYSQQSDAYLSVQNALLHSAIATKQRLVLHTIESSALEVDMQLSNPVVFEAAWTQLRACDGILVPGGFGSRGIEGKIAAIQYAREAKKPFLGICLGFQLAVVEYSRHVLGWATATSEEFLLDAGQQQDTTATTGTEGAAAAVKVIALMPESGLEQLGGTMRLGLQRITLAANSHASTWYAGKEHAWERHRHRYEVNVDYVDMLQQQGLQFVGKDDSQRRMEILELAAQEHPYFLASQFHPEYQSRPLHPAPVFVGFMDAMKKLH